MTKCGAFRKASARRSTSPSIVQTNWSPLAEGTWGAVGHAGAPARRGLGGAVRSALARGVRAAPPRRLPGAGSLLAASGVTSTAQAGGAHEAFRAMARPALGGAA